MVMQKQKVLSPLKTIESKPHRKTRAEILLRVLISSSYQHSLLSNLTVEIAKGYGLTTPDDLNNLARDLRDQERTLSMIDFIRCIEIQRTAPTEVVLTAKRLNQLEGVKQLVDNAMNHETVHSVVVQVEPDGLLVDDSARKVAVSLLGAFHRSRVQGSEKQRDVSKDVVWKVKERRLALGGTSHNLGDLKYDKLVTVVPYEQIVEILVRSLQAFNFHILVTQNNIILRDQDIRIMIDKDEP